MPPNTSAACSRNISAVAFLKVLAHYHETRAVVEKCHSASANELPNLINFLIDVEHITSRCLSPGEHSYAVMNFFLTLPNEEPRTRFDQNIRYKLGRAFKKYGLYPIQKYFS